MQQELFDKAAEDAKALPDKTSNDDKLSLYGLFKQATSGDVNTGMLQPDLLLLCTSRQYWVSTDRYAPFAGKPGIWDPKGEQYCYMCCL